MVQELHSIVSTVSTDVKVDSDDDRRHSGGDRDSRDSHDSRERDHDRRPMIDGAVGRHIGVQSKGRDLHNAAAARLAEDHERLGGGRETRGR
eukprot:1145049-Prorocentrum_minimum.AAC.6